MEFHNPYQFVPFGRGRRSDVKRADFVAGKPEHVTHDRYVDGSHSGRLVCRLITETPIFVGAKRHAGSPARVDNFRLDGELAIPSSSLRGLVSGLAEAASNSAVRVLDTKRKYSYRKPLEPEVTLSAMGMAIQSADGSFMLKPLSIPTLKAGSGGVAVLPKEYQGLFPEPIMKVHIGSKEPGNQSIDDPRFPIDDPRFRYRTFTPSKQLWFVLPLEARVWGPEFTLPNDPFQKRKPARLGDYVIGQLPWQQNLDPVLNDVQPDSVDTSAIVAPTRIRVPRTISPESLPKCRLGIVRVLGCWGNRQRSMPPGKKHELFLPWPSERKWPKWPLVPIPSSVVASFNELCAERTDDSFKANERDPSRNPLLPFEPLDTRPNRKDEVKLQHGDIVYFRAGEGGRIEEISFSAVWRDWVYGHGKQPAPAREFFPKELLPFDYTKDALTPADLLFGFVEDQEDMPKPETQEKAPALALAGRVRFSHASLTESSGKEPLLDEVTLKILDGPKPPCPSMYFRGKEQTGFIPKRELSPLKHEAQGRKYYLHHKAGGSFWETGSAEESKEQKSQVRPIAAGQVFHFHIDFDNLSDAELGLLLYALAPADAFRHKIGMGKAIGLGSVHIEPLAWLQVNRKARYTPEGLIGSRYTGVALAGDADTASLPEAYRMDATQHVQNVGPLLALRDRYRQGMHAEIRNAIELVGDPAALRASVRPPLCIGQASEKETFRWFVANDRSDGVKQFLRPLGKEKMMPVLSQIAAAPPREGRGGR